MYFKMSVYGDIVDLKIEKIKSYPRFTLYQVYKIEKNKKIPVYKTCYTELQLKEIRRKQNFINFEEDNIDEI